jgi:hypothetical protein
VLNFQGELQAREFAPITDVYIDNSGYIQFRFGLQNTSGMAPASLDAEMNVLIEEHLRGVPLLRRAGLSIRDIRSLLCDPDSLPERSLASDERIATSGRHMKIVKEEILPALAAALLFDRGAPIARGVSGADILSLPSRPEERGVLAETQIKVLHRDSPVLQRESGLGRKKFLKLLGTAKSVDTLLLVQESARDSEMLKLAEELVGHGVPRDTVTLLMQSDLREAGVILEKTDDFPKERVRELSQGPFATATIASELNTDDGFFPIRLRINMRSLRRFNEKRYLPEV